MCAVLQSLLLSRSLSRLLGRVWDGGVVGPAARMLLLTAIMSSAVVLVGWLLPEISDVSTWMTSLVRLLALTGTGAAIYLAGARVLRMPELGWALGRDRRS